MRDIWATGYSSNMATAVYVDAYSAAKLLEDVCRQRCRHLYLLHLQRTEELYSNLHRRAPLIYNKSIAFVKDDLAETPFINQWVEIYTCKVFVHVLWYHKHKWMPTCIPSRMLVRWNSA